MLYGIITRSEDTFKTGKEEGKFANIRPVISKPTVLIPKSAGTKP